MSEQRRRQNQFAIVMIVATTAIVVLVLLSSIVSFLLPERYSVAGAVGVLLVTVGFVGAMIISVLPPSGREARAYPAAIREAVKVVPLAGILGTIVAYSTFLNGNSLTEMATYSAIAFGVLFALVAWLVATLFYSPSTSADHANPTNYFLIREQLDQLENQHKYARLKYAELAPSKEDVDGLTPQKACEQAALQFNYVKASLKKTGLPWITGVGYIDLWRRVHRAEEALIMVESREQAIQEAERDKLRLTGSNLTNRESLTERLDDAITALQGNSKSATDPTPTSGSTNQTALTKRLNGAVAKLRGNSTSATDSSPEDYEAAKATLSEVRYEINSFNDDVWAGIIRARNRLLVTSLSLGLAAYVLLTLAIIGGASPEAVLWAGIYAIVGASIGLFARSRAEANADTATDDFGLSTARLIHTPIFSGLGAVLGVLVIEVLDRHFLGVGSSSSTVSVLQDIFSNSPNLLVFAAVFGLVPDLAIQRLTQQAEKYRDDLRSTQGNRDQEQQNSTRS